MKGASPEDAPENTGRPPVLRRRPPLHYPDEPVHRFLRTAAERHPERTALRFEDQSCTFRELDAWGTSFANALAARGIGLGDRVLLAMSNRTEWLMAQHGVSQVGAASVLVNPSWKREELLHAMTLTRPAAVVADGPLADLLDPVLPDGVRTRLCVDDPPGTSWASFWELAADASGTRPPALHADLGRLEAVLPFSSGTTGMPKAVRHTHRSLSAAVVQRIAAYAITDADRLQFFLALSTIYGVMVFLSSFAAGSSLRLFRRFDAEQALQNLQDERITIGFGAAPIAVALQGVPDLERYDLSALRYMMWGATPILPELAAQVTRRSGIRWMQAYATTEAGIASNPAGHPDLCRLDSAGIALSDVDLRTVDPDTAAPLAAGQPGEIVVKGPSVMLGYLPAEDDVSAFLPDGSFRTGDIGWIDRDGWVFVTDRVKELIKVSGFQVAPAELERVLSTHPRVLDCAVYGMPDARRGEVPWAAVVPTPGDPPGADQLMAHVAAHLARYKHLAGVQLVEVIPRNGAGKILRRHLRAAALERAAGAGAP